jgi:hypothetical protein
MSIEALFHDFLESKVISRDKDIEYCLLQSTVEPTIRFKFGAWLNEHFQSKPGRLTLNLMEANRIDLVIGIDDNLYLIEFGHLLNILKHTSLQNSSKISSDSKKFEEKAQKLIEKINRVDPTYLKGKQIHYLLCSLFSDLKVVEREKDYATSLPHSRLQSGTLFKYGSTYSKESYFQHYQNHLNNTEPSEFPYGYKEVVFLPDQLSLHYKFETTKA